MPAGCNLLINGGIDWINAAAITGNLMLDLTAGASSTVDGGVFITISNITTIENAVTGDGNDSITGNDAANILYGMRGNDTLSGAERVMTHSTAELAVIYLQAGSAAIRRSLPMILRAMPSATMKRRKRTRFTEAMATSIR